MKNIQYNKYFKIMENANINKHEQKQWIKNSWNLPELSPFQLRKYMLKLDSFSNLILENTFLLIYNTGK